MKYNAPLRTLIVWIIITILSLFGIFAPRILGIDTYKWAITFSDICFFVTLCGIIAIIIFMGRARIVTMILKGQNILMHWEYSQQEWNEFAAYQYDVEKKEMRLLFCIIAGFLIIVGSLFIFMTQEGWLAVLIVVISIIVFFAFISWFTAWNYYSDNKKYPGETYFTENAVYINHRLHLWKGLGSRLESINLVRKNNKHMVDIYYMSPIRFGLQNYPVSIPVPEGKVKEAKALLEKLGFSQHINPDK